MSRAYRCDGCGKTRVNVTVVLVDGEQRDLCPECRRKLPELPSQNAEREFDPKHHDPLIRRGGSSG